MTKGKNHTSYNGSMMIMCHEFAISSVSVEVSLPLDKLSTNIKQTQQESHSSSAQPAQSSTQSQGLLANEQTLKLDEYKLIPPMGNQAKRLAEKLKPQLTYKKRVLKLT